MKNIWTANWLNKLGVAFFVFSAAVLFSVVAVLVQTYLSCDASMYYTLAGTLVALSGVLAALGANLLVLGKNDSEKTERDSRFHLDSCAAVLETAYQILADGNTSRAQWVRAGRMLMHAQEIAKKITEKSHLQILDTHFLNYRYLFADFLEKDAIDFFGVSPEVMDKIKHLKGDELLDAAVEQRRQIKVLSTYETHDTGVNPIPETALYAVWKMADFPEEYKNRDPLNGLGFSPEEVDRIYYSSQRKGFVQYLHHRERTRQMET